MQVRFLSKSLVLSQNVHVFLSITEDPLTQFQSRNPCPVQADHLLKSPVWTSATHSPELEALSAMPEPCLRLYWPQNTWVHPKRVQKGTGWIPSLLLFHPSATASTSLWSKEESVSRSIHLKGGCKPGLSSFYILKQKQHFSAGNGCHLFSLMLPTRNVREEKQGV